MVIVGFVLERQEVTIRGLLRRAHDYADLYTSNAYRSQRETRPNKLVWTDHIFNICADLIKRKCYIQFYTANNVGEKRIPVLYNWDRAVDCFYICCRLVTT